MCPHLRMHLPPAPQCRSTAQPHSSHGQTAEALADYPETVLKEIGMYHMMKESAVEKAKNRAVEKMKAAYPSSRLQLWRAVHRMMRRPVPLPENNVGPQG